MWWCKQNPKQHLGECYYGTKIIVTVAHPAVTMKQIFFPWLEINIKVFSQLVKNTRIDHVWSTTPRYVHACIQLHPTRWWHNLKFCILVNSQSLLFCGVYSIQNEGLWKRLMEGHLYLQNMHSSTAFKELSKIGAQFFASLSTFSH